MNGLGFAVVVGMRNVPHRFPYLNTRPPVGGAVRKVVEPLGGGASLEEESILWRVLAKGVGYSVPSSFYTKM